MKIQTSINCIIRLIECSVIPGRKPTEEQSNCKFPYFFEEKMFLGWCNWYICLKFGDFSLLFDPTSNCPTCVYIQSSANFTSPVGIWWNMGLQYISTKPRRYEEWQENVRFSYMYLEHWVLMPGCSHIGYKVVCYPADETVI